MSGCNQEHWHRTETGAELSVQLPSRHQETPATPRGERDESWREGEGGLDQSGLLPHMTVIPSFSYKKSVSLDIGSKVHVQAGSTIVQVVEMSLMKLNDGDNQ